jgi:hypothetical protein
VGILIEEYYNMPIENIYKILGVDPDSGMDNEQARLSLEVHGKNEIQKVKKSLWHFIIAPIINILIIIYFIRAIYDPVYSLNMFMILKISNQRDFSLIS